jgi:hypothetical protein
MGRADEALCAPAHPGEGLPQGRASVAGASARARLPSLCGKVHRAALTGRSSRATCVDVGAFPLAVGLRARPGVEGTWY